MKHSSVLSICVVTIKPNLVSLKPHHISIQFAAASDSFDIISRRPVFVKMICKKTSRKTQKNPTREKNPMPEKFTLPQSAALLPSESPFRSAFGIPQGSTSISQCA